MKFLKKIINRLTIVSFALLIQLCWIAFIPLFLNNLYYPLSMLFSLLSFLVVAFIINKQTDPSIKLAWIVPILIFPFLGWVIYLLFGTKFSTASIRKRISEVSIAEPEDSSSNEIIGKVAEKDPHICGQMQYVAKNNFPVYENSYAKYYPLGDEMFPDLLEELKKAEKYIFIEIFIIKPGYMWDSILEILIDKAKAGLDVRVMYDDIGCINHLPSKYYRQLEKVGIKCISFNRFKPFLSVIMNNRDHRKIMIIDGKVAFTGGVNFADEYINKITRFGHWKDAAILVKGDAVKSFIRLFLEMWNGLRSSEKDDINSFIPENTEKYSESFEGLIQPYGSSPLDSEILGENIYLNIINSATKYVYIFTPYLVIDNVLSESLILAAKRGVDVRIVIPAIPDKKTVYQLSLSHCPALIDAGVKIYNYTPGFIHSKCFVCDDKVATVGTVNMDYRSLYIHFECGCIFYGSPVISDVYKDMINTFERSSPLVISHKRKGIIKNFYFALLRLFAPLL